MEVLAYPKPDEKINNNKCSFVGSLSLLTVLICFANFETMHNPSILQLISVVFFSVFMLYFKILYIQFINVMFHTFPHTI